MPRRREVPKREILPDPKFGNVELSKFMNVIMEGGKKAVAERIIYGALELIEKKHPDKYPLEAFTVAINNVKPMESAPDRNHRRKACRCAHRPSAWPAGSLPRGRPGAGHPGGC